MAPRPISRYREDNASIRTALAEVTDSLHTAQADEMADLNSPHTTPEDRQKISDRVHAYADALAYVLLLQAKLSTIESMAENDRRCVNA